MNEILDITKEKMNKTIDNLNSRLANIRAGRASASLVDGIEVEYYGTPTPLNQLANISIPEARSLMLKPFDKSLLQLIEKAIFEANIGLTPNNNGEVIILNIPALTEETRKQYVKQAKGIAEEAKIALRNIRQDENNNAKKLEITEDEIKGIQNDIQDLINEYNKKVDDIYKVKEKELMTV